MKGVKLKVRFWFSVLKICSAHEECLLLVLSFMRELTHTEGASVTSVGTVQVCRWNSSPVRSCGESSNLEPSATGVHRSLAKQDKLN